MLNTHRPTRTNPRVSAGHLPCSSSRRPQYSPQAAAAGTGLLTHCHGPLGHLFHMLRGSKCHQRDKPCRSTQQPAAQHLQPGEGMLPHSILHAEAQSQPGEMLGLGAKLGRKTLVSLQDRLLHQESCRTPQLLTPPTKYCPGSSSNSFNQKLLISTCSLMSSFVSELTADGILLLQLQNGAPRCWGAPSAALGTGMWGTEGGEAAQSARAGREDPAWHIPWQRAGFGASCGSGSCCAGSAPGGSSPARAEHTDGQSP